MLILLNSSKTMSSAPKKYNDFTIPEFINNANLLANRYQKYSVRDLMKSMKISEEIANKTSSKFQNLSFPHTQQNSSQAIFIFKGSVYKHIEADDYSKEDLQFAQEHLRILSGLYGVLKPLDLIQPYRLEMALTVSDWKGKINLSEIIINLASQEYFSVVKTKEVITPVFKDGGKIIAIYSKFVRGMMANWIIKNKIIDVGKLKNFTGLGYKYSKSEGNSLIFVR